MADFVSGSDVLAQVGASNPSAFETEWADLVASAVNDGIGQQLGVAVVLPDPPPPELVVAARYAATEAYKRREVAFGVLGFADLQGTAYRVARDYLEGVKPITGRYRGEWGIG